MPTLDESIEAFNLLFKLNATAADLSAVNLLEKGIKNKRISPRYVRDDIVVALCEPTTFFGKETFVSFVKLNDIASRGLAFSTEHQLVAQKKIILNLWFQSEIAFKINATIVYKLNSKPYQYGAKFDEENHDLADHILETQRKLVFR